jgi:hypothetical protein
MGALTPEQEKVIRRAETAGDASGLEISLAAIVRSLAVRLDAYIAADTFNTLRKHGLYNSPAYREIAERYEAALRAPTAPREATTTCASCGSVTGHCFSTCPLRMCPGDWCEPNCPGPTNIPTGKELPQSAGNVPSGKAEECKRCGYLCLPPVCTKCATPTESTPPGVADVVKLYAHHARTTESTGARPCRNCGAYPADHGVDGECPGSVYEGATPTSEEKP